MRLIDADALKETLDKIPARSIENADGRAYVLIRLSTVFEIIKQMPSAQPRTGKWKLDWRHNRATCSECGFSFYDAFDPDTYDNFCRHCGADMRGERR